jgi:hypothetical protein
VDLSQTVVNLDGLLRRCLCRREFFGRESPILHGEGKAMPGAFGCQVELVT